MNILWVTPQLPCTHSGGQVRQYHLLQYLCRRHVVTVLSLVRESEIEDILVLQDWGAKVIAETFTPPTLPGPWRNRFRSWRQLLFDPKPHYAHTYPLNGLHRRLRETLAQSQPAIVHLELLFAAPLAQVVDGLPWVLAEQNVESRNIERQSRQATAFTHRLAGWIETQKLRRWERMWLRRSPACIVVSERDAATLHGLAPDTKVFVVPNGVDVAGFAPPEVADTQRTGLLFFGNLGYVPNADAVTYFCQEIFPRIRSRQPDVTLDLVGAHAPPAVVALGNLPGVRYVGFVEDVRPYLWRAATCVVPLRSGGGTRFKILESLAAGCPVVSTTLGVEGLDLRNDQHLVVADDPNAFAEAVFALLTDSNRRYRLAEAGKQAVANLYDWSVIGPQLETVYDSVRKVRYDREYPVSRP